MPSKTRLRRFRRRIEAVQGLGRPCDVCRQSLVVTDANIQAMDWHDAAHLDRPPWFVVLCGRCCAGDFAESLNQLHRLRWERTHTTHTPDNWLLR